jgi:hypothetical protein
MTSTTERISQTRSYQSKAGLPLVGLYDNWWDDLEVQAYASLDAPEYMPLGGALACCGIAVVSMPIPARMKL